MDSLTAPGASGINGKRSWEGGFMTGNEHLAGGLESQSCQTFLPNQVWKLYIWLCGECHRMQSQGTTIIPRLCHSLSCPVVADMWTKIYTCDPPSGVLPWWKFKCCGDLGLPATKHTTHPTHGSF